MSSIDRDMYEGRMAVFHDASAVTQRDESRSLLGTGVEDDFDESLRDGHERIRVAVRDVQLFVTQTEMVGDRNVGARSHAVAAAVGSRRVSDHAANAYGKRRVRRYLIRVRNALEPLPVVAAVRKILCGVVERERQRSASAYPNRGVTKPGVEPSVEPVVSGVVLNLGGGRRRSVRRKVVHVVLHAAMVGQRKARVLGKRLEQRAESPVVGTGKQLQIDRAFRENVDQSLIPKYSGNVILLAHADDAVTKTEY